VIQEPTAILASPPAARPRPSSSSRSLAPREHGAYGQLGLPLATALAMGRPGLSAVAMTVGAVAVFLAHEPILVVTGQRGSRALREVGPRAKRRIAALGTLALVAGGVGLYLAPRAALTSAVVPLALAMVLAPFIARGEEKSTTGELLAAATLSGAGVPVAIASGVPVATAWSAWGAWCLAMATSTLAVRSVIAHAKGGQSWARRVAPPVVALGLCFALAATKVLDLAAAVGAAPMLALSLALAASPPSPRSLKRVGWALVGASVALAVCLAVSARA
jgi:hypothetical protein